MNHLNDFLAQWNAATIEALIDTAWGRPAVRGEARMVCWAESSYKPLAFNAYVDSRGVRRKVRGLFQISDIHRGGLDAYPAGLDDQLMFDPVRNVIAAKELYSRTGTWAAWSVAPDLGLVKEHG